MAHPEKALPIHLELGYQWMEERLAGKHQNAMLATLETTSGTIIIKVH